ncbi:hypothetical protein HOLleu_30579 [Holothuria leucospilota]|uniref:Uncharacterized protein n=1 Tax=Holothuria leucospilota TaxID=206669 RepID=A0A9Q1BKT1_HOLLE|nr:hypothetical protein HOLleu_30579 [Holothuria leucospilota]
MAASTNPSAISVTLSQIHRQIEQMVATRRPSCPTWKCNCKIVYNCGSNTGFPEDGDADTGCLKDLASYSYPMNIAGKRWRRNLWNSQQYCQRECERRLHAFLCLDDDGDFTPYSYGSICAQLILGAIIPVTGGTSVPCCETYLEWGPKWCEDSWYRPLENLHCYIRDLSGLPSGSFAFGSETCSSVDDTPQFNWCTNDPTCTFVPVI